jgi:hypothetical protein
MRRIKARLSRIAVWVVAYLIMRIAMRRGF